MTKKTTEKTTSTKTIEASTTAKKKKISAAKAPASNRKQTKSTSKKATTVSNTSPRTISLESRQQMIEETAYYLAEQRGFSGGDPLQDWVQAEFRVNEMLA